MAEETKQTEVLKEKSESEASEKTSAKSGLMKYVIIGAGGIVVSLIIAIAVGFMLKDKPAANDGETAVAEVSEQATSGKDKSQENHNVSEPGNEIADSELNTDELDQAAIDKIMDNLAFLDYEPEAGELDDEDAALAVQESLSQVNWLEQEKATLAAREKEVNSRAKELDKLEKQVNQKILQIEQAESARIAKLAKLYDGMDSRSVAKLMANLDDATVVSIIPRMNVKNASAVLQLLPAQRAARLSKQMITIAGN